MEEYQPTPLTASYQTALQFSSVKSWKTVTQAQNRLSKFVRDGLPSSSTSLPLNTWTPIIAYTKSTIKHKIPKYNSDLALCPAFSMRNFKAFHRFASLKNLKILAILVIL